MKGGAASELEGQGEGGDLGGKSLILNLVISRYLGGQGQGLVALGKFVKMSFFVLSTKAVGSLLSMVRAGSLLSFLIWSTRITHLQIESHEFYRDTHSIVVTVVHSW